VPQVRSCRTSCCGVQVGGLLPHLIVVDRFWLETKPLRLSINIHRDALPRIGYMLQHAPVGCRHGIPRHNATIDGLLSAGVGGETFGRLAVESVFVIGQVE